MSNSIKGNARYEAFFSSNDADDSYEEGSVLAAKVIRSHSGDFVRRMCKARGVTVKPGQNPHVARFAYIDIPLDSRHGAELSCCHPVCIASGRRFRYCTHCETAVAKRNFNIRHAHGKLNSPPDPNPKQNVVPVNRFGGEMVCPDTATCIPTVISINDHKDSKSLTDDTSCTVVSLSAREYEIITLLRSRPAVDYPLLLNQWKEKVLGIVTKQDEGATTEVPSRSSCIEGEEYCTSADENDDDAASFSVDEAVDVDFSSVFDG